MIGINRAEDAVDGIVEADAAWQRQSGFEHVVPTATTADDVWEALRAVEPSVNVGQPNVERVVVLARPTRGSSMIGNLVFSSRCGCGMWSASPLQKNMKQVARMSTSTSVPPAITISMSLKITLPRPTDRVP